MPQTHCCTARHSLYSRGLAFRLPSNSRSVGPAAKHVHYSWFVALVPASNEVPNKQQWSLGAFSLEMCTQQIVLSYAHGSSVRNMQSVLGQVNKQQADCDSNSVCDLGWRMLKKLRPETTYAMGPTRVNSHFGSPPGGSASTWWKRHPHGQMTPAQTCYVRNTPAVLSPTGWLDPPLLE